MAGSLDKSAFNPTENYNEFYGDHKFTPLDEKTSLNVDLVLPRAAWALDVAQEIQASNALDLCCLDGFVALTLSHKLGISTTGVDLSRPGIKLLRERAKKHELPIDAYCMAIEDYKPTTTFDLVVLFEAIEHFTDVDKTMAAVKACMHPGATLLVSTPDAEGKFGIENTEDVCHLQIYTHRKAGELPTSTHQGKPIISLPDYLQAQGFEIEQTAVWNELVHVRAKLAKV